MTRWPDLCPKCLNRQLCAYVKLNKVTKNNEFCPGMMAYLNNDVPRREELVTDVIKGHDIESRDYKAVISEKADTKDEEHAKMHDRIMGMPDRTMTELRRKGAAALAYFYISPPDSARLMRVTVQTIYNICKGAMGGKE